MRRVSVSFNVSVSRLIDDSNSSEGKPYVTPVRPFATVTFVAERDAALERSTETVIVVMFLWS